MTAVASFSTPNRVMRQAAQNAGLLQEGNDLSSEKYAEYTNRLNDVINSLMQTQGLKLWTQADLSITLVSGTNTYTLGPTASGGTVNMVKPLRVIQGYYLDSSDNRRPIYPLSWNEWLNLSQVTQTGQISQYFVDKQQLLLSVKFWLTPDATAATGTAHLLIQQQVTNFTGITDTLNFPIEWFNTLQWCLADEICTGQPQAIMDRCRQKADMYRTMLENWDVEDASVTFQPDSRGGQNASAFR